MQLYKSLDDILHKIENNVKDNFEKIKEFPKYLDERLKEIGNKISEYTPIIVGAAISASPLYAKAPILTGLQIKNLYKSIESKILGYGLMIIGFSTLALFTLLGIHGLISPNNGHLQYLGSSNGYQGFVPDGVISYKGHIDPKGELVLDNGITLNHVIWNGQDVNTIIKNYDAIEQLDKQKHVNLQNVYIIKGEVPTKEVKINGQIYYVIDANRINKRNIIGYITNSPYRFLAIINILRTISLIL
jgi:hypothetical protein